MYTLWLPEQYPTECRASAFAFATSFARFGGAGITFLVGAGVRHFGSLGTPVAMTAIAFAIRTLADSIRSGNARRALAGLDSAATVTNRVKPECGGYSPLVPGLLESKT